MFAQIAKPGKRRKQMSASLVGTGRSMGEMRGVLARIALAASQIAACHERFGADQAWGFADPTRAPRTIDFAQITGQSSLLLAHAQADVANAAEFPTEAVCPCHVREHLAPGFQGMCARLWWEEPLEGAQHRLALFASFPIPQIEVVSDPVGDSHLEMIEQASKAGVPVIEVER